MISIEFAGAIAGVLVTLQLATLAYCVRTERRLTRLETIEEVRGVAKMASKSS